MTDALWTGYQHRAVDVDGWTTYWRLDPRGHDFRLIDWTGYPIAPVTGWDRAATPAGVRAAWRRRRRRPVSRSARGPRHLQDRPDGRARRRRLQERCSYPRR